MSILVILLGGEKQNDLFWPSYYSCEPGINHDLLLVHRDFLGVASNNVNKNGKLILENKIINGNDVPHKAFGAYRYYFSKYKDQYEYFIFVSDDVVIRRDNWLLDIIKSLNIHDKIGFGASQIFNGHKKYPHPSHLRAPFWFAKSSVLKQIEWIFNDDHDGEMRIGDQCTSVGYIGIQVGNKLDLAYDSTELNHVTQILEKKFFPNKNLLDKFNITELNFFDNLYHSITDADINSSFIESPNSHIGVQNIFIDMEPFNNLIYYPSLDLAKKCGIAKEIKYNIYIVG